MKTHAAPEAHDLDRKLWIARYDPQRLGLAIDVLVRDTHDEGPPVRLLEDVDGQGIAMAVHEFAELTPPSLQPLPVTVKSPPEGEGSML